MTSHSFAPAAAQDAEVSDSSSEQPGLQSQVRTRLRGIVGFSSVLLLAGVLAVLYLAPQSAPLDQDANGEDGDEGVDEVEVETLMTNLVSAYSTGEDAADLPEVEQDSRALLNFRLPSECSTRFKAPVKAPLHANHYNGVQLNGTCFTDDENHTNRTGEGNPVFIIGDWGGIRYGQWSHTADHTKSKNPVKHRAFNWQIDRYAQHRVAKVFNTAAAQRLPDYVLNVGDNFYWSGVRCSCGKPTYEPCDTAQFKVVYENVYKGPGVDGVQWLSVLGNHDYGGYRFSMGWDQAIAYTWRQYLPYNTGRWIQPAQFYGATVYYQDSFAVDYFFVDTNPVDGKHPWQDQKHNICSGQHNWRGAGCGAEGPANINSCWAWFRHLWHKQKAWLDKKLGESTSRSEWQIIVTHFPAAYYKGYWAGICKKHGIDLFISGHRHEQLLLGPWHRWNPIKPTAMVISGGGGGITSEHYPNNGGWDDEYGFMDMTIWKDKIRIKAISHGAHLRRTVWVHKRYPDIPLLPAPENATAATS